MLHVITPGWSTRVVDLGRPRTRSLGVPLGGAADRASLILGNGLVGNPENTAALEVSAVGPTLRAETELACVVCGAPFELTSTRQKNLRTGVTFTIEEGEEVRVAGTPRGLRAYFCVRGGFQTRAILDSRSSLEMLTAGTMLACETARIGHRFLPPGVFATWNDAGPLRIVAGLQAASFNMAEFLGQEYAVSAKSDRMGLRIEAKPLMFEPAEMTSEPVCPGAVQVTRDGQCIILGVDGQTIGGYPKIAHVVDADLDRLGQLRPGQRLRFAQVDLAEALTLGRQRNEQLAEWMLRLQVSLSY